MQVWLRTVQRDLRIGWRRRSDLLSTLFFFVIVASLFPPRTWTYLAALSFLRHNRWVR